MTIHLPERVKEIIDKITNAGYEAYAVGGCIRDTILGRFPEDWDITTSASPQQVKALFKRTIDTGIQHGTVTVMLDQEGFEVTTYRIDGEYEDGRHPREVIFTPNLKEDLKRRDFTINAMAYNEKDGLIDLYGGLQDIEAHCIRCVGNAEERFTEDALRIMRAIRFSAQLGYEIEADTKKAIQALAPNLRQISVERIQAELVKLITSDHPEYLKIACETGVTAVILPEFDRIMETQQNNPHHYCSVGEHTLCAMKQVEPFKNLRLAMLFHDIAKPVTMTQDESGISHFHGHAVPGAEMTGKILRRLRFDNDTISTVKRLVLYHDYGNGTEPDRRFVRRAVHKIGEDLFTDLLLVKRADILAQSSYEREEKLKRLARLQELYQDILKQRECVSLKTLAVNGKDLIELGIAPGKEIGEMLHRLLEMVIDTPEYNNREYLLSHAAVSMEAAKQSTE